MKVYVAIELYGGIVNEVRVFTNEDLARNQIRKWDKQAGIKPGEINDDFDHIVYTSELETLEQIIAEEL